MKVILEVFYIRIMGDRVNYQRKQVNLSKTGVDPDALVQSLIRYQLPDSNDEPAEFMVHSTSWRHAVAGKIVLTYIAYSDDLVFGAGEVKNITLKQLRKINISTGQPRSPGGRE